MSANFQLLHLYRSPGHNYFGHHGKPPGKYAIEEVFELRCRAGRGIEGDRFLDHKENYKGQITFFAHEVYRALCEKFQVQDKSPSVFRRNVITRGVDLNSLIGVEFIVQGVRFLGMEECKPCYWMDRAFHPGAEQALKGQGGLRAQILSDGVVRVRDSSASPPFSEILPVSASNQELCVASASVQGGKIQTGRG